MVTQASILDRLPFDAFALQRNCLAPTGGKIVGFGTNLELGYRSSQKQALGFMREILYKCPLRKLIVLPGGAATCLLPITTWAV